MSYEKTCLPVIQQVNNIRIFCHNINYDHKKNHVPLVKSIAGGIGHRVATTICIPANALVLAGSSLGVLGSCVVTAVKIVKLIFTGKELKIPTGFNYFCDCVRDSFWQIDKNLNELLNEHAYRVRCMKAQIISPSKDISSPKITYKTLPGLIEGFNNIRLMTREKKKEPLHWISHKVFSIVNIPLNYFSIAISMVGMEISAILLTMKVALYFFTGIKIKSTTHCVNFYKTFCISSKHLIKNIDEIADDCLILIADIGKFLGLDKSFQRVKNMTWNTVKKEALNKTMV